ncbi:related to synaptic vesicle transporter SVOP and related transporters (major facilitator superfamily) [Phialocephala subalpina]|uniref:Related to synaptic vesicle transporter SVOP and related transporters (Major facilitator superfamily) n=1 Tax=Phialocephala subalpina TaxID=576137 RepID=A0A1L7WWC5_9HELO|nr:related to synaptic vesicle transporter SVOP and related transporters (major facilitator superfamily) [Phialocephala subalpina]
MSSQPPPSQHEDTLSALTNHPRVGWAEPTRDAPRTRTTRRKTSPGALTGMYNRHSMQVFADFQHFESPRNSSRQRYNVDPETCYEEPRSPTDSVRSLASSTYSLDKKLPDPPYHVFTLAKKKQLVYIVSLAGLFSPLSSNIYFPALGQISRDLHVSLATVSLTVTVYMVVQGLAPSFWGPLSDTKGRRITFIGTFAVYLIACFGLAFSNDFVSLMIFRAIQAAGSAATISVGAGVIGDITTAQERGGLIGVFGGIRMLGQSIGPVFGGIISQYLGFHAIFWFLFGLGGLTLLLILLILPETQRAIAGNGTIQLQGVHRPLIYSFSPPLDALLEREATPKKRFTIKSIIDPLKLLREKDVIMTLLFGSIVYTVWSMVTSSTTALFQDIFHLNDLQVGLVFLPNGAGTVSGSILMGKIMDWDYRKVEKVYKAEKGIPESTKLNKKELLDFPLEKARLPQMWWIILLFTISTALYGFSLKLNQMALPLILQFIIAFTATATFTVNSAYVVDLYPGMSASATAVNNLVRCSVGAFGVAIVQVVIDAIGAGPSFALFAGITLVMSPMLVLSWFFGQKWRDERREKVRKREEAKKAADVEKVVVDEKK